jgi:hypothetical protein
MGRSTPGGSSSLMTSTRNTRICWRLKQLVVSAGLGVAGEIEGRTWGCEPPEQTRADYKAALLARPKDGCDQQVLYGLGTD